MFDFAVANKMFLFNETCQLKIILEEPVNEEEPTPYKMAKWAYKACMDDAELEVSLVQICSYLHYYFASGSKNIFLRRAKTK